MWLLPKIRVNTETMRVMLNRLRNYELTSDRLEDAIAFTIWNSSPPSYSLAELLKQYVNPAESITPVFYK